MSGSGTNQVYFLAELCQTCGKVSYQSSQSARLARKQMHTGRHLSIYRCSGDENYFHLGHLPTPVIAGLASRSEIYAPIPPDPAQL